MSTTGSRVRALGSLLVAGRWLQVGPPPMPRLAELGADVQARIRGVYDALGGRAEVFEKVRPGGWDLAFETPEGPVVVELDEEQHFNRYRLTTLAASDGRGAPWTPEYQAFCVKHESRLLPGWSHGNRWTNASAPRFFGEASPRGDLTGVGAPRWRQRAFHDAFKDAVADQRLARISVYDVLPDGRTVEAVLRRPEASAVAGLRTLLGRRTRTGAGPVA